jgi:signal transduction histidine kinase
MFYRHYLRDCSGPAGGYTSHRSSLFALAFLVTASASTPHAYAQAQPKAATQVYHDFFGFREGAPEQVRAIAQTSDGYLWLGSQAGLYRFDGNRFELFEPQPGEQLLSNNITALLATKSGGLWVGYLFGGFSLIRHGHVQNFADPSGSVSQFAQNEAGSVLAVASDTLWQFQGERWQPMSAAGLPSGQRLFHAGFDRAGTLWVIAASGLLRLEPNRQQFELVNKEVAPEFTLDADGAVVTREVPGNAAPSGGKQKITYPVFANPVFGTSAAGIIDRTNSVWVEGDGSQIKRVSLADWLSGANNGSTDAGTETYEILTYFAARLVDREGDVWLGGPKGVDRLRYSPLIRQRLSDAVAKSGFFAVAAAPDSSVWIVAGDNGPGDHLCRVTGDHVEVRYSLRSSLGFAYSAPDNTLWFSGYRALNHLVGHDLSQVDLPSTLADQWMFLQAITQDNSGGLWVSFGRHGLYRVANGVWTSKGGRNDLPDTGVLIEYSDSLGRVWFGYTHNKLAVLEDDHVRVFERQDGLLVGTVTAIQGRGSHVWIGGEFGLQRYDQGHLSNIAAVNDEWLRGISGIVETRHGDLWVYGLGGIFHIPQSQIVHALQDPAYPVTGEHFDRRQGVPGEPQQLRPLHNAVEGSDGRIWFAGTDGVAWIDAVQAENRVPPLLATIQSVSADGRLYASSDPHLPAHTSQVQFAYSAISLSDPEAVRYRYKLDETDRDWHEARTANPVTYRNLPPGSYHFRVTATDINGVWYEQAATTEFSIQPAFYQTRWFYLLCALLGMALLIALYRVRVRRVATGVRNRMEERLAERERIARDLHDTLLQGVQGLMLRFQVAADRIPKGDPTREMLDRALERADQIVDEGRARVRALRAPVGGVPRLPQAVARIVEQLAPADASPFRITVEGAVRELDPIVRDEVQMLTREALTNAYRHANASEIEAEIAYADDGLTVRIRDDGRGIDDSVLREGRPGHFGLIGMRERAKKIRARLGIWSKPGAGTEVEIHVPAAIAYRSSEQRSRRTRWWRKASTADTENPP